ncbi:VPLPA-CTERM sorting domain-containing protein [Sneathiella limimaris]|uniref:VPLPA-CTERM sorting domain-containing protein n=1 Tax=Sneathiella limimaris TaxID=1964213 RepID=UPI00146BD644|nr:VPLPA-CTERM sorting domain-containing protein [Sneathiella limimaris]
MFKKLFAGAAVAAAVLFSASLASAASFDFTSGTNRTDGQGAGWHGNISYSVDGISVNATPVGYSSGGQWIRQYDDHGLAVYSGDYCCNVDSNHEVDGWIYGEAVKLTFSEEVYLTSVSFTHVDRDDQFAYRVNGGSWTENISIAGNNPYGFSLPGLKGTVFDIAALDWNDDWKLSGVTVSAVPLPPAVLMFGAALAGLGWFRRRKAAA